MTKVKICGITNIGDAQHAIRCGADAIGFNFYNRSPRYIRPDSAASIVSQLGEPIDIVGVFVNEHVEMIADTAASVGLTGIQLHGDETPAFVDATIGLTGLSIIKAFRVGPEFSVENIMRYKSEAILLDAYCPDERGGTGNMFDWEMAGAIRAAYTKLYLAGGLSPINVAKAIRTVRPFAVDACSLLESEPGRKHPDRVAQFISAAKEAL
jgi:phosphoribosylanthranilate isomerase